MFLLNLLLSRHAVLPVRINMWTQTHVCHIATYNKPYTIEFELVIRDCGFTFLIDDIYGCNKGRWFHLLVDDVYGCDKELWFHSLIDDVYGCNKGLWFHFFDRRYIRL